jgi:hypothetical protein
MNLLKKEIQSHKNLLLKYKNIIPAPQLPKFEKDIETIFKNFENIEEDADLDQIRKLAKIKFNALKKIYGDISDEKKNKFEIFDEDSQKIVEDMTEHMKEQESNPNFKEMLNSPGFNPLLVKKYREEYNQFSNEFNELYIKELEKETGKKIIPKTEDELKNNPNIQKKIKEMEAARMKDHFALISEGHKEKYGDDINIDEENINEIIDKMMTGDSYEQDKAMYEKIELQRIQEEKEKVDLTETDNLFKGDSRSNIHIQLTEEQQKILDEKLDKILSDKKLTDKEKAVKTLKIINDTESEILKSQCDGEVHIDQYGNFQFKVYEEEDTSSDGTSICY